MDVALAKKEYRFFCFRRYPSPCRDKSPKKHRATLSETRLFCCRQALPLALRKRWHARIRLIRYHAQRLPRLLKKYPLQSAICIL